MRFNQGIHNILAERGIASENTAMLFKCFYGAIRQINMATDSFNIYLSPVYVKSLNRFVINWQAGAKLIRHAHEYNGFVTLNVSTRAMTNSRSFGYESNFNKFDFFFKIRIFVLDMAHCYNVTHYTPNPTK